MTHKCETSMCMITLQQSFAFNFNIPVLHSAWPCCQDNLNGQARDAHSWCLHQRLQDQTDGHHFFSRLSAGCLAHRAAWSGTFSPGPGLVPQCDNVHASHVSWQHNTCCQPDPHTPPLGDKGLTREDTWSHKLHGQCGRTLEDSSTASL